MNDFLFQSLILEEEISLPETLFQMNKHFVVGEWFHEEIVHPGLMISFILSSVT